MVDRPELKLSAPRIMNWAYALLWWRETHRPHYDSTFCLYDGKGEVWSNYKRVCKWITREFAEALYGKKDNVDIVIDDLCIGARVKGLKEGESNLLEDLKLYSYFTKDSNESESLSLSKLATLATWIGNDSAMYLHGGTYHKLSILSRKLLYKVALDEDRSPFFYTPYAVSNLISSIFSFYYDNFIYTSKYASSTEPSVLYDPSAGYGELLLHLPVLTHSNRYYYNQWDTLGLNSQHLTRHILSYAYEGDDKFRYKKLNVNEDKADYIISNPPSAWSNKCHGFNWAYIKEHVDMLNPNGLYITTCSKNQFDGTPDEHDTKVSVLSSKYLKCVIQLPNYLLKGISEAPLILVFHKTNKTGDKLLYIDGTNVGYDPTLYHSGPATIKDSSIKQLVERDGVMWTFHMRSHDPAKRVGQWGVGILADQMKLLVPNIKFDMIFYKHGSL